MWNLFIERRDFFLGLVLEHIEISLIAIVLAIVIGGLVGIIISQYQKSSKLTLGMINFLYTIPSISLLGFLIPFSGIGNVTAIIALTIYALLPMVRNTYTGIINIDNNILEAAKGMGSTEFQILYKIKLPLAMPVIMSGIRSMVTMTIALAGIASFIGAGGLGVAIYRGITTNNAPLTIVGSLLIAVLALVTDFILGMVEKKKQRHTSKKRVYVIGTVGILISMTMIINTIFNTASDTIRIATKPMSEQYVIGEILEILIEQETDLEVELIAGVGGGTSNIQPAMEKGDFDIYPEYTGTGWNMVLKKDGLYTEDLFSMLQEEYQNTLSMQWIGMYGFNNTFGLAVRSDIAKKYNLKTYSDLQAVASELIFGAEYDFFEREDGYDPLCERYQLTFKETMDVDIGLKYQAINQGKIDIMNIATTDGQISVSDIVVLEDDLQFYPSYQCGNIIRNDTLEKHPELQEIFNSLTGILSDQEMAKMNYEVDVEGKEPGDVAKAFLKEKGLLKE
jgi:osmoprotectant transport system permease protein